MANKEGPAYTALGALEKAVFNCGHSIEADSLRKAHPELTDKAVSWETLERVAREVKMRAVLLHPSEEEFREVPAPAIVRLKNGEYIMVGVHNDETVMFLDIARSRAVALPVVKFMQIWSGEVLAIAPMMTWAEFRRRYNLEWFYRVILRYKRVLGEVMLASAFLQSMGIMFPLFTQVVIDKVVGNGGLSTLTVLGVSMLFLAFIQTVLQGIRTYLMNQVATKLDAILGTNLFRHLISLPVPYYEHRRVGDTLMRVGAMGSIRNFLTGTALTTILDVLFSLVFICIMLYYSVSLTLIALIIVPLYVAQSVWAVPIFQQKIENVWRQASVRQSFLVETVTGMQTIKALAIEPQFLKRWENNVCRFVQANFDTASFNLLISSGNSAISTVSNLVILWAGGYMVMRGEFTLGQLIAFQMLAGQAIGPLTKLLTMWPQVQQSFLALERLGDILHSRIEPVLQPSPAGLTRLAGNISVQDVSFRYRLDLPWAVEKLNFEIKAGEKVGIVGRSGSGKSTLAGLLERIYQQDEGVITMDGTDLRQADLPWLRRQMGVVQQDSYLFDGSVRDNIAAARPAAPMTDIMRAAQLAGAHEFILELDEGYDTRVGERGASLSGGQRQRIAIARALLTDPRVLIFDEATSALDYESERIVMKNIESIAENRTMIIIAHRLVTVEHCDKILVLDHGKLIEQGSPAELLAAGGMYAKLAAQQSVE